MTDDKPDLAAVLDPCEWLQVSDHHWVSVWGEAWSGYRGGRYLTCSRTTAGYPTIWLDGRTQYVHTLLLEAFVGSRPNGAVGRHRNDIPDDNRLANLEWGTRAENAFDYVRNGGHLGKAGELHPRARLSADQVRSIRVWRSYGFNLTEIGDWFGVAAVTVSGICTGRSWKHVV